jgi:hypothetical protein
MVLIHYFKKIPCFSNISVPALQKWGTDSLQNLRTQIQFQRPDPVLNSGFTNGNQNPKL